MASAIDKEELFSHVQDADYFLVPRVLTSDGTGHLSIPQPLARLETGPDGQPIFDSHGHQVYETIWRPQTQSEFVNRIIQPVELKLTKFMILELVVALTMIVLFVWLARRMRTGNRPRGRTWNMLEVMLLYLRDRVARPAIGSHDADRYVPLVWTVFFFVLGCNLMGLLPWMGSPTGALATTAALATVAFITVVGSGVVRMGIWGYLKSQVPPMELSKPMAVTLVPMIFAIELFGLLVKHFVLAIRLFANMLGGHVVLGVLMAFIVSTAGSLIWWGVMPASVLGSVALNLLEILVAFIQAYIFAFLTSLFIGMAVHPH
jgi:F-type H+-transporting ATPase subunit a